MSVLSHLLLNMSTCVIRYTLSQTYSYLLGLNPWLCIGFKLVWVEKNRGFSFGWAENGIKRVLIQVWF